MKHKTTTVIAISLATMAVASLVRDFMRFCSDSVVRESAGESRYERTHPRRR